MNGELVGNEFGSLLEYKYSKDVFAVKFVYV